MRILVAFDNTPYSIKALESACDQAKTHDAALDVVTVYHELVEVDTITPSIRENLKKVAEGILAQGIAIAAELGVQAQGEVIADASAASGVVAYAVAKKTDLIVMGHKSKSGIEKLLVGSVASSVVTYAPCSVLVVR